MGFKFYSVIITWCVCALTPLEARAIDLDAIDDYHVSALSFFSIDNTLPKIAEAEQVDPPPLSIPEQKTLKPAAIDPEKKSAQQLLLEKINAETQALQSFIETPTSTVEDVYQSLLFLIQHSPEEITDLLQDKRLESGHIARLLFNHSITDETMLEKLLDAFLQKENDPHVITQLARSLLYMDRINLTLRALHSAKVNKWCVRHFILNSSTNDDVLEALVPIYLDKENDPYALRFMATYLFNRSQPLLAFNTLRHTAVTAWDVRTLLMDPKVVLEPAIQRDTLTIYFEKIVTDAPIPPMPDVLQRVQDLLDTGNSLDIALNDFKSIDIERWHVDVFLLNDGINEEGTLNSLWDMYNADTDLYTLRNKAFKLINGNESHQNIPLGLRMLQGIDSWQLSYGLRLESGSLSDKDTLLETFNVFLIKNPSMVDIKILAKHFIDKGHRDWVLEAIGDYHFSESEIADAQMVFEDTERVPLKDIYRQKARDLPASVSLRHQMSAVKDQRSLGTCTAFSVVACAEFFASPQQFSEAELWLRLATFRKDLDLDCGLRFAEYPEFLNQGLVRELNFPPYRNYTRYATRHDGRNSFAAGTTLQASFDDFAHYLREQKIHVSKTFTDGLTYWNEQQFNTFTFPWTRNDNSTQFYLLKILLNYCPVPIIVRTFQPSLFNLGQSSIVDESLVENPSTLSEKVGHAITLCGYDEQRKAFQFKNSWGSFWGDSGYGWIAYDHVLKYLTDMMPMLPHTVKVLFDSHRISFEEKIDRLFQMFDAYTQRKIKMTH